MIGAVAAGKLAGGPYRASGPCASARREVEQRWITPYAAKFRRHANVAGLYYDLSHCLSVSLVVFALNAPDSCRNRGGNDRQNRDDEQDRAERDAVLIVKRPLLHAADLPTNRLVKSKDYYDG